MSSLALRTADTTSRRAALTLALCLPSDVLLYLLLPMESQAFGITLAQAGVLLAANRLVRIFGYRHVLNFYARNGDRLTCMIAAGAATVCALGNSMLSGFAALLGLRLIWGLCFAALNLSTQVLATSEPAGAARRAGRSRAVIALGPMLALPLGGWLTLWAGPRPIFLILAGCCLAGLWVARGLPTAGHDLHSTGRRFKWPDSVAVWSFIEGVALDGLFIFGLSIQAQKILGGDAVLIAGGLMALRYASEMLLSPLGGRAAQRFGATSMLLLFSFLSALALTAFGSYWVIVGAAAVLVLRALQLPLVTTLVAERNPGSMRVSALASNAVWRDVGAGLGPLMAGLLLPVASAPWVFGLAGAAIAVSAVFCWRAKVSS
ncbi:UNVERIFIED_ORG: MFS family permease [Pseudomonas fluorescens]|jgi:MFS family permease|uniref:MFS transporter n=3 Tax=Pseudomonas TaxID=286 RepID=A0A1H3PG64_9PSED|nr:MULTISPECIES: MFS transporter [Pseudomonas]KQM54129.1 MFS transporter [Pseudomonas sp. Leaf15]MDQ0703250.1 DHA1 family inner membrane transport protein [Pseudomonas sp. W3I7]NWF08051.1 MFS transporter [Pseudomonas salomonii]PIB45058.1 MFS transporter [Pseudomonas sp. 2822-15]RAG99498.1 MFS transporter [Pseudomonas sp. Leaf98]